MNYNFTLCCETCDVNTNVRLGLSNREEQPVRFACQSCGAPIDIVIGGSNPGISGATTINGAGPFDPETPFVDLHLDFPVSFEPYVMGMTPFLRAAQRIGFSEMQLHDARLTHLNTEMAKARQFRTLLKLYSNQKYRVFKSNIASIFDIEVASDRPEDINAALYQLIHHMMLAYEYPGQSLGAVDNFTGVIFGLSQTHKVSLESFIQELIDNSFLKRLQLDVLEIYPRMLDSELVMRPALFLDFDAEYAANPIPMRVSAKEFETYKDLYKDISEIISRELVLVAGLNNLLKRGNADAFAAQTRRAGRNSAPATLNAFADVVFGSKLNFIDDSWYDFIDGSINNRLRNAIAHYKAEYDDVTQIVTYYATKEGMEQNRGEQIYFLEFVRRLLISYREMHRLHHLIKSLFYYYFFFMRPAN